MPKKCMELYVKPGPNGSIGDCPFAHFVRIVMNVKKVNCNVHPCSQDQKPDWLINKYNGKMPCLDNYGDIMVESSIIAEYLDKKFPNPPLVDGFDEDAMMELKQISDKIFPNLAKFLKSKTFDGDLEKNLLDVLSVFEKSIEDKTHIFLLGNTISMLDCSLIPKLYILNEATQHYYPETHKKFQKFEKLSTYMQDMFKLFAFTETKYPVETMLFGWDAARG